MTTFNTAPQKQIPFRANEWWFGKAMLMMGLVYFFVLWFDISFSIFIQVVIPSLATIVGFAAFGYLVNDLFDRKADARANKKNTLQGKSPIYIASLFGAALLFVFVPWLFLPSNKWIYILIGVELSLFLIYSIPPLRLKEKGLWGVGIDALYAHALPAIIAGYTYVLIAKEEVAFEQFLILFLWQFSAGARNILMHQHDDKEADLIANTNTYIALEGIELKLLVKPLLIFECFAALLLFGCLTNLNLVFGPILLAFILATSFIAVIYAQRGLYSFLDSAWRHYPNVFYEKWMPILLLILLSFSDAYFLIVLFIHSVLFNLSYWEFIYQKSKAVYLSIPFAHVFLSLYTPIRILISWIVNHIIFATFLLFGVNLKKENCSAMEYLKRKRNQQNN